MAAATIPRGPIQLIIIFSEVFKFDPIEETQTESGRAMNITIAKSTRPWKPTLNKLSSSTRAAKTINSTEINKTVNDSLNSRICSRGKPFQLAKATPITVTANRPDSCSKWLDIENSNSTKAKVKTLCKNSGIMWRLIRFANTKAPNIPMAVAIMTISANKKMLLASPPEIIYSYTNTTAIAPTGSMIIPSHFKMLEMVLLGRTLRSNGMITVGPVTQTKDPKSKAMSGSTSNSK